MKFLMLCTAIFYATASSSSAQTAHNITSRDNFPNLGAAKSAMQEIYNSVGRRRYKFDKKRPFSCVETNTFVVSSSDVGFSSDVVSLSEIDMMTLADVSYLLVFGGNAFKKAGYPASVYQTILDTFGNNEILHMKNYTLFKNLPWQRPIPDNYTSRREAFLKELGAALDVYQLKHPSLRKLNLDEGECGGGTQIYVRSQPPAAQIMLISRFNFAYCKAMKIDPENRDLCEGWKEVMGDEVEAVSGNYEYLAVWPKGVKRRGTLQVDNRLIGDVVTISKP